MKKIPLQTLIIFFVFENNANILKKTKKVEIQSTKAFKVKTTKPMIKAMRDKMIFFGKIRSKESVLLQSDIVGTITFLKADGAFAKKGETIVELNHEEADAKYMMTLSRYNYEKRKYQNMSNLANDEYLSQEHLEEQKSKLEEAEARMKEALAYLNKHLVKAPFDGILGLHQQNLGSCVTQHTQLVTITNPNNMEVEFSISEKELQKMNGMGTIKEGTIFIYIESQNIFLETEFSAYEKIIDSENNCVSIRAKIIQQNKVELSPGLNCKVILNYGETKKRILIPKEAIMNIQGVQYVYIIKNNTAIQTLIEIGYENNQFCEVISGITENDEVVIKDQFRLLDGQTVEIDTEEDKVV